MVKMTRDEFEKHLGPVEFDEETMANFGNIVLEKAELRHVTGWYTDVSSFEGFVQENVRQALLVFMSGLYLSVVPDGVCLCSGDEVAMKFTWMEIVGYENFDVEDREMYRQWTMPALAAMRKVIYERLKTFPKDEEEAS